MSAAGSTANACGGLYKGFNLPAGVSNGWTMLNTARIASALLLATTLVSPLPSPRNHKTGRDAS